MKKTTLFYTLMLAGVVSLSACGSSNSSSSSTDSSSTTMAKVDTAVNHAGQSVENATGNVKEAVMGNPDSNFVVKAAIDNAMELKVLQAGVDKGTNKDLKSHAKMMITDHKKLGAKVKAYADKKGYVLPADDNGKADDALASIDKNSAGADWDKAWVNKVTDAHKDAVSLFEQNENDTKDPELKSLITDALPTLRNHLDMMKGMQDKMGK